MQKTQGIVLIDEIDMHLHPKWQWNIVKALKKTFPMVQFIVTTHSPIVVASCKDENIILLHQNDENKYRKTLEGWQVDDVLEEIMQTGNRSPETMGKLQLLKTLSRKRKMGVLTSEEKQQYGQKSC